MLIKHKFLYYSGWSPKLAEDLSAEIIGILVDIDFNFLVFILFFIILSNNFFITGDRCLFFGIQSMRKWLFEILAWSKTLSETLPKTLLLFNDL